MGKEIFVALKINLGIFILLVESMFVDIVLVYSLPFV